MIGLPPVDVVPELVRLPLERFAGDTSAAALAELVDAVDRVGATFEYSLGRRAVEARAELVEALTIAAALHDELVDLHAAQRWLRGLPWRSRWERAPYAVHLPGGRQVAVPELLGAVSDTCAVDPRLIRIARQSAPSDPPYAGPAPRPIRSNRAPATNALAEAGLTLLDVAEQMSAGVSTVSKWLSGDRRFPDRLQVELEQLLDAETAARIVALIPARASLAEQRSAAGRKGAHVRWVERRPARLS